MRTDMPNPRRRAYYTVRDAAWILGVDRSSISRLIRLGALRTVSRNGRRVIPASELARQLGEPSDSTSQHGGTP